MSEIAGQDEARRALVDRHLAIAESVRAVVSRRRQELNLSLQQVADRSGLTKAHVWEVEQGRSRNVCISSIVGLASGLGVSEGELLGLTALRAPSLDRGAEEMRTAAEKVCRDRSIKLQESAERWAEGFAIFPPQPELAQAFKMAADHCDRAAGDIRALPVPADLNEGGGNA